MCVCVWSTGGGDRSKTNENFHSKSFGSFGKVSQKPPNEACSQCNRNYLHNMYIFTMGAHGETRQLPKRYNAETVIYVTIEQQLLDDIALSEAEQTAVRTAKDSLKIVYFCLFRTIFFTLYVYLFMLANNTFRCQKSSIFRKHCCNPNWLLANNLEGIS